MTAVWAWSAAVGVVVLGVIVGRLLARWFDRRMRLHMAAVWASVNDDYAVAYLEELHRLRARTPEHERRG